MNKRGLKRGLRLHARKRGGERKGEAGVGLVEAIIGLLVFTILMIVAGQLMRVHVETLLAGERQRKAGKQAEAVLNTLVSKKRSELADGGAILRREPGFAVSDVCRREATRLQ